MHKFRREGKETPFVRKKVFQELQEFSEYDSMKKFWMTNTIFEKFLRKLDSQMYSNILNILLFADQFKAHVVLKLHYVLMEIFPANCINNVQPCDLGILQSKL